MLEERPRLPAQSVDVHVPTGTILKVLVTLVLIWALVQLRFELFLILVSILLAIAASPLLEWASRRRLGRGLAILVIALGMIAIMLFGVIVVLPPFVEEIQTFQQRQPEFERKIDEQIGPSYPFLARVLVQVLALPSAPGVTGFFQRPLVWGKIAVGAATSIVLVLVLSLYFLVDGKRLYAWLLAYVPRTHRKKMALTVPEVFNVVRAYVRAQMLTSFLFASFAFSVLSLLGVPAALSLALFAGLANVVPVVGALVSTIPAVLFALTVSPVAAVIVVAFYLLYNLAETYLILPRVYGTRLRLSTLAVVLGLMVGGALAGIVGAVLVLPLVAAYPIIERIWLHEYLGEEVAADHAALEEATGEEHEDAVVERVLEGSKHSEDVVLTQRRQGTSV